MISLMIFFSLMCGMLVYKVEKSNAFMEITSFLDLSLIRFPIILMLLCIDWKSLIPEE